MASPHYARKPRIRSRATGASSTPASAIRFPAGGSPMRRLPCVALLSVVLGLAAGRPVAADPPPVISPTGYYEGSVTYACNYFKDRAYTSMILTSKADFWFSLEKTGPGAGHIQGEGVATFDFSFSIDWTMNAKMGISIMNVMGAKLDPKVSLTL